MNRNPAECQGEGHTHDGPPPTDDRSPLHQAAAEVLWAITMAEYSTAIDHLREAYEAER